LDIYLRKLILYTTVIILDLPEKLNRTYVQDQYRMGRWPWRVYSLAL